MSDKQFSIGVKISIVIACIILIAEVVLAIVVLSMKTNTTSVYEDANVTVNNDEKNIV